MILRHWKVSLGDFREKKYDLLDHCYSRTRPFQFDVVKVQNIISRAMHKKVETVRTSGVRWAMHKIKVSIVTWLMGKV